MTELYSLSGYGSMIADHVRIEAYTEALRRNVRHGSVVLDIGTGPGIFAVLACRLGASRVYALEPDNIIQVARDLAAANGCANRIEFIQDISSRVTLPVRADVMISDLRGVLPFFQRHIPSITDARRRLLAPGGILIPRRDTVWVAVVEAPLNYGRVVDVWERNLLDQNLRPARELAVNNIQKMRLKAEQLLTRPQLWATLDYATIADTDARGELQWAVERAGIGHGIVVWFDAELADGVGFSCGIDTPDGIYGSLFFPWRQPISLLVGQIVRVNLDAKLMENDYVWRWTTQVQPANGSGEAPMHFDQSQLNGALLSLTTLHKGASGHVPQLSDEGRLHRRALELMDGKTSLEEIARLLSAEFPQRFARWQQALSYAGTLSQEYSR